MNYLEKYKELKNEKDDTQERINELLESYAVDACPYEIGETVEIKGYSHQGKKGIVSTIEGIEAFLEEKLLWKVTGNVLKKDGTKSRLFFDFNEDHFDF